MDVPKMLNYPADTSTKSGVVVSTTGLGFPTVNGINNLLGYVMGGLKGFGYNDWATIPTNKDLTLRLKSFRHPNADALGCSYFVFNESVDTICTVGLTAGTGTQVTNDHYAPTTTTADGTMLHLDHIVAEWDGEDSGICDIEIDVQNGHLITWSIYDIPRASLASTDTRATPMDDTHAAIRLGDGGHIAESDTTGPHGWTQLIYDAWDNCRHNIFCWARDDSEARTTGSASWTEILQYAVIKHRGRRKKSTVSKVDSDWYMYTWCDAGVTYDLRVESTQGVVDLSGLTNTTGAWTSVFANVGIDATADETIELYAKRTAGAGNIYISACVGIED
ncbi:MAG: hypothetical protein ACYTBJ_01195 [Planctomycetota bacterium]|jgi:hypothetical protein